MRRYLISHGTVIDATGAAPRRDAALLIEGNRIAAVGSTSELRPAVGAAIEEIDATGKTVMPGLIDGHVHLNFNSPRSSADIDLRYPAVYMGMLALSNAGKMLRSGYTSAVGGGGQFNVDVWVKRAIKAGVARGPRIMACSREITTTGGAVDWHPSWQQVGDAMLGYVVDGPQEMLKGVRALLKEGVDAVKIYTSGEGSHAAEFHSQMYDCLQDRECMTVEEIEAAASEVRRWGRTLIAHARDPKSIKSCIRARVDILLHATYIDEEGLELIVKFPPRGVVPALMPPKQFIAAYDAGRVSKEYLDATRYREDLEVGSRNAKLLHSAGIRVVPGGEYGLIDMPHGDNARDLKLFLEQLGFTPMEAICAATRDAAHLMQMERELGTLEVGKLADVLIVDGDPLADITVLQQKERVAVVMRDGEIQARHGSLLPL